MQCELAVIVDDGMARIGSSLKSYNDVRLLGEHIGNLSLALIAPVSAYYCFNHFHSSCDLYIL